MDQLLDFEAEQAHGDRLAEMLTTVLRYMPEDAHHIIAVIGSQITIGQVAEGVLAVHAARRAKQEVQG